jgi:phage repressor protein C with HTH and peptisase S24 domain
MTIQERILQFIEYKGISAYKFCKDLGLSLGYLDKRGSIGTDKYLKIIDYYKDVNANWLLTGKGEMLSPDHHSKNELMAAEPQATYQLRTDKGIDLQKIPLYQIEAAAGIVPLFAGTHSQRPVNYLSIPNLPKCDGAVYVNGDSMYPLLKSGDMVVYKVLHDMINNIIWGEMYILSTVIDGDDYVFVKYVQKNTEDHTKIRLVSHNKHHQDIDIRMDQVRTMAIVKASVRINAMVGM